MKLRKLLKDEKGSALPFITIVLGLFALGFIALVVDVGILFAERKAMITSADAAALAGAQVLRDNQDAIKTGAKSEDVIESEAETAAKNYAIANGADESEVHVFVGHMQVTIPSGTTEVRQVVEVSVGKNQPLYFARFLGDNNTDVKSYAIATWGYVLKSAYFPIFVFDGAYNENIKGSEFALHDNVSIGDSKTNSYGFVEVNNNPNMSEIIDAINGTIDVEPKSKGDLLGGVPGNRNSVYAPTYDRIGDIVIIPVIDSKAFNENENNINIENDIINGNSAQWQLKIMFFAYFKITNVTKQNFEQKKSVQIEGEFTGKTTNSNIFVQVDDQIDPNPNGDIPPTYIKLIK